MDLFGTLDLLVRRAMAVRPGARRGSLLVRERQRLTYRIAVGFAQTPLDTLPTAEDPGPADAERPDGPSPELRVVPAAAWYRAHLPDAAVSRLDLPAGAGVVVVPVHVGCAPIGYLAVEQADVELPDREHAISLRSLADSAGAALERHGLYDEMARSAEEIRVLQEVLGALSAPVTLRDLVETLGSGIRSLQPRPQWTEVDLVVLEDQGALARTYRAPRNPGTNYWHNVRDGAMDAARALGARVEFKSATLSGSETQAALIEDAIRRGVDGIAVAPVEPEAIEPMIRRAWEAGIPVVAYDTPPVPDSRSLVYIGTDNVAAGRLAGEWMKRLLPDGGAVVPQLGLRIAVNCVERLAGFTAAVGDRLTVLPAQEDCYDVTLGTRYALSALREGPAIAGAFGGCGENGPAWGAAAKAIGRAGELKIVAFDLMATTVAMLREGCIHASVVQREVEMGRLAVQTLCKVAREGVDATIAALPPSRRIDTGVDVVTLERTPWSTALADYLAQRAARRSARPGAPAGAVDRAPHLLVIGMIAQDESTSEETAPFSPTSLLADAMATGRSAVVDPSAPELDAAPDAVLARAHGVRTRVLVPLLAEDEVLGVLVLSSAQPRACSADDLAAIERIAGAAATVLEHARLLRRLTERTRALEVSHDHQASLLEAVNALSSPVVPVATGILVMPLVGTMDTDRSGRFIDTMLREIKARQARVVLIDVTGLALVDAAAAEHLGRAAHAAQLLGAEVVLVGIAPDAARLLVEQGVDFGRIVTKPDLQRGFRYALAELDGKIVYRRR